MSVRDEAENQERQANQGICIKCRRLLPAGSFLRDITGNPTAWCNVCREEIAKNWGVDLDQVEWVRCMYAYEKFLTQEAETAMLARINMNVAVPADLDALRARIHHHHMLRHSRISGRLRQLLKEYRESFYQAVRMDAPDLSVLFPVPANAAP